MIKEKETIFETSPSQEGALKAPFPWFGGKARVASVVWRAFGDVANYVEPFFGSGAVLLGRPEVKGEETVNDYDGFISNFWRAIKYAPEETAEYADWPVNECDLHARHIWLLNNLPELSERLCGDPDYYDAKIAGWWVWGICSWIGTGWCSGEGSWQSVDGKMAKIINTDMGVYRKIPHLAGGRGINRTATNITQMFSELSGRFQNVRVCSGDWSRVTGPSVTFVHGMTGVFLDPPYSDKASRDSNVYRTDCETVAHDVREWCIENGDNPLLRIALCGYEGEHDLPDSWTCVAWKAHGGYGSLGNNQGRENKRRERIWFSPACLPLDRPEQCFLW